jgi:limonene 1,2-monooxygenase
MSERGVVIGTPDDAIAEIERLQGKQGEFGCFLQLAHNWADWEATKKSYELYARFVVPHFRKSNQARDASLAWAYDHRKEFVDLRQAAAQKMIDTHEAEQAAKRQAKGRAAE